MTAGNGNGAASRPIRCAIYTRKSTSEGLDMDFNTLDAQREAAENYIKSQTGLGWTALPTRYDDGGFTGANLERPALRRLLEDIDRGALDKVVVYKVDRLSRSLLDFSRMVEVFDKRSVGFVSITQQFDTSTSMGRLVLNVLLSFAQFERELISERTRDKIAAARRRGKWTGGPLILGYRIDHDRRALAIVPEEATVVRLIFELYWRTRSICSVAQRLNALGHPQKRRVTRAGKTIGGGPWTKSGVHRVLRNPLYAGKVPQGGELYRGEHEAIVGIDLFDRVQKSLKDRSTGRGPRQPRKPEYILTGVLRCVPCDAAMTSSRGRGSNGKSYRYYRCRKAQNEGTFCPNGLIPSGEVEAAVIAKVKEVGHHGEIRDRVLAQLEANDGIWTEIRQQRERLTARLADLNAEAKRLLSAFTDAGAGGKLLAARLGEIEAEMDQVRVQLGDVEIRLSGAEGARSNAQRVTALLDSFGGVWEALVPAERRELLHLIVRRVYIDPDAGALRIVFHDLEASPTKAPATPAVAAEATP